MITHDDIEQITDYAMPMMNIEKFMRRIHDSCLNRDFKTAQDLALRVITEGRILQASLVVMQNKELNK